VVTREQLRAKIWPADTFVDFEQGLYNSVRRLRDALNDSAENPCFIETLSKRGYRFVGTVEPTIRKIESLAVLPLENLSRDPEQEYFAEGLTEALITRLAKIGDLRIASRTSAMAYKSVRKALRQIAVELGVDAIVEGTVLRDGERVRITAQLIDAQQESHLWAESYERDLRDILSLQAEIAQAIAHEIRIKIVPQERTRLAQVHPVESEAYEAYLKGRYYWNRRSGKGVAEAIQFFQQAIVKDPSYAAAYSGLADCLVLLGALVRLLRLMELAKRKRSRSNLLTLIPVWRRRTRHLPGELRGMISILRLPRGSFKDPLNSIRGMRQVTSSSAGYSR
jgi:TolB-like protein